MWELPNWSFIFLAQIQCLKLPEKVSCNLPMALNGSPNSQILFVIVYTQKSAPTTGILMPCCPLSKLSPPLKLHPLRFYHHKKGSLYYLYLFCCPPLCFLPCSKVWVPLTSNLWCFLTLWSAFQVFPLLMNECSFTLHFTTIFISSGLPNFDNTQVGLQESPSAKLPRLKIIVCKIKEEKNEKTI